MSRYSKVFAACLLACGLLALGISCQNAAVAPDARGWQKEEQEALDLRRSQLDSDAEIALYVSCIGSPDGETVFLGGSYRTPADSYRSVLLVSKDAGKTWRDSDVWLAESEVCYMYCLDAKHAWVMTCWSVEGNQAPYDLFRTTDGGQTWERSASDLTPDIETSLSWPTVFSFSDAMNGTLAFQSTAGDNCTYETRDGGINWFLVSLEKTRPDLEDEPTLDDEERIPSANDPSSGRVLRYRADTEWEAGIIRIEALDKLSQTWSPISTLPFYYRLPGPGAASSELTPQPGGRRDAVDRGVNLGVDVLPVDPHLTAVQVRVPTPTPFEGIRVYDLPPRVKKCSQKRQIGTPFAHILPILPILPILRYYNIYRAVAIRCPKTSVLDTDSIRTGP